MQAISGLHQAITGISGPVLITPSSRILSSQYDPNHHPVSCIRPLHNYTRLVTGEDTSGGCLVNVIDSPGFPGSGTTGQSGPDLGWFLPIGSGLLHAPTQGVGNDIESPGPLAKQQREEESDDSDGDNGALQKEQLHQTQLPKRLPGACTNCKRLKVRFF
ncbi:hypothetical protein OPQ81_008596 [Rhizoctonia solani]|nr:hypothetical protein OPQ81_008596 [Rhizoctonia solani]